MLGAARVDVLRVRQRAKPYPGEDSRVRADIAVLRHHHGATVVRREAATMTVHGSPLLREDEIVHPFLWQGAALCASWMGRETLHGGAFLDDAAGAWVILGDSGDGKSSLLAALALRGREVLADDLIVAEGDRCFAGPRCIDLSGETAQALGLAGRTKPVRWSQRERFGLARSPRVCHCAGSCTLLGRSLCRWRRFRRTSAWRCSRVTRRVVDLGVRALALLDFAGAPALLLSRPRGWGHIDATCAPLLDAVHRRGAHHAPAVRGSR